MAADGPQKLVFVGGAPRSGTTVAHALLCTSNRVNRYHPEISFYRGLPMSYRLGRVSWKEHTHAFFDDLEAFRLMMREASDVAIGAVWRRLGEPEILCMKDPLLTPLLNDVQALYPTEAWFVVTCRHPCDVVRSRQEVHEKTNPDRPFGLPDAVAVAREYLSYYRTLLSLNFGGRMFLLRYEDLNAENARGSLSRFIGIDDLMARPLWGDEAVPDDSPWSSPKYNQAIDLTPRFDPLAPELEQAVKQICAPVMVRFNYK